MTFIGPAATQLYSRDSTKVMQESRKGRSRYLSLKNECFLTLVATGDAPSRPFPGWTAQPHGDVYNESSVATVKDEAFVAWL